jgi:hypothetical protein
MNTKRAGTALLAAVLAIGMTSAAIAQGGGGFQRGQRGQGGQGGQRGQRGGFGGPGGFPGGMVFQGGPGAIGGTNPLQPNPMGLLQRPEVQNELGLDLKQKNAIAALEEDQRTGMRDRMRQAMQGQTNPFQNMTPEQRRNMTPEQRQQMAEQMRQQIQPIIQAAMNQWQGELSEKIKAILKPEQVTRLYQLDLQKRGPMAMGDARVAQQIKLTPQSATTISKIANDWQAAQQQIIGEAFREAREQNQMPDFQNKLSPARKKIDQNRQDAEAKALATLSADEKASWQAAIGREFRFRPDAINPPQNQQFRRRGGF